jgi:hypothetical protein
MNHASLVTGKIATRTLVAATVLAGCGAVCAWALFMEQQRAPMLDRNAGASAKSVKTIAPRVHPATGGTPYGGTPHAIPGTIETEDYDLGGEGVAYHDMTTGNAGGVYRTDDVDIKVSGDTGGGYAIGWFQSGEWLEYTVDVARSALYDVELRFGSIYTDRSLSLTFNGTNVTGAVAAPLVGAWDSYLLSVTVSNVSLTAGQQTMRVVMGPQDWVDINWIKFTLRDRDDGGGGTLFHLAGRNGSARREKDL